MCLFSAQEMVKNLESTCFMRCYEQPICPHLGKNHFLKQSTSPMRNPLNPDNKQQDIQLNKRHSTCYYAAVIPCLRQTPNNLVARKHQHR